VGKVKENEKSKLGKKVNGLTRVRNRKAIDLKDVGGGGWIVERMGKSGSLSRETTEGEILVSGGRTVQHYT